MAKCLGLVFFLAIVSLFPSCKQNHVEESNNIIPKEIVDLGTVITEDLPYRIWGKGMMDAFGFEQANHFDVREWEFELGSGTVSGSNAYYTLFNHGGPHMDAPNHIGQGKGLDSYSVEQFVGPLKVFDVSNFPRGHTIPVDIFKGKVKPGDVVLIYTKYLPPQAEKSPPEFIALSFDAAEYLAELPIKAFATDAFSVDCNDSEHSVNSEIVTEREIPIHYAFLTRSIPIYEQLCNVDKLLAHNEMLFVAPPLNIKDGDGMPVRPLALVY